MMAKAIQSKDIASVTARVFISYSRQDRSLAEPLRDALIDAGFDAYLDIYDIAPSEPWQKRLADLIATAEKVIFLISPDSVTSDICIWEVDNAAAQGKGVLPVMLRETKIDVIPGALQRLNFIFYRNAQERETGLQTLIGALRTDLDWERERTRINNFAIEWQTNGKRRHRLATRDDRIREMERWRDRHPATALPPTELQLAFITASRRLYTQRQRWFAIGFAVVGLTTTGLGLVAFFQRNHALETESRFLAEFAQEERESGATEIAMALALAALPEQLRNPLGRPFVPTALVALTEARYERRQALQIRTGSPVGASAMSPDGTLVAAGDEKGGLTLWDAHSGSLAKTLNETGATIHAVAFSPDGARLLTGGSDSTVRLWDVVSGKEIAMLDAPLDTVWSVAFSPDGSKIVAGGFENARAEIWEASLQRRLASLSGHGDQIFSVAFSPDGKLVATGSADETIRIWNVETGIEKAVLEGHEGPVWSASFSPNGARLVSGSRDRTIRIWDVDTAAHNMSLLGHRSIVFAAAFSPNGERIVSGSFDQTVRIWDAASGVPLKTLRGHADRVWSTTFSGDGMQILSSGDDGTVRIWAAEHGVELRVIDGHEAEIWSAAFSPDGKWIATASSDSVKVWEASTGAKKATLTDETGREPRKVAFSPDGYALVVGFAADVKDSSVLLWQPMGKEKPLKLIGHSSAVNATAFSEDGRLIATGSSDRTARIWDAQSGELLHTLDFDDPNSDATVRALDFSSNGKQLLIAGHRYVRLYSVDDFNELASLPAGQEAWISDVAFSPNDTRIAVAEGKIVRVYSTANSDVIAILRGHDDYIWSLAFSPAGARLVTSSSDNTARIWDATTGEELATLRGHAHHVTFVSFNPHGEQILSASRDGQVRLWPYWPDTTNLLSESKSIVKRIDPLTQYVHCRYHLASTEACRSLAGASGS